jgi:hypothetical protein
VVRVHQLPVGRGPINFEPREESLAFDAARAERLKISGNPSQYDNLHIFIEEQELMRRLAGESLLPKLELDISDNHLELAVNKIGDRMESTGGLWMAS